MKRRNITTLIPGFLKQKKVVISLSILLIFLVGLLAGGLLVHFIQQPAAAINFVRAPQSEYELIDPVLYTTVPESVGDQQYGSLKNAITSYVQSSIKAGNAQQVSVYYRDLNSNLWIGVNPDLTFWPASMLKVVVLMSVLHEAESSPGILSQQIVLAKTDEATSEQDFFPPSDPAVPGQSYSIDTLLQKMIVQSDNNANTALNAYIGSANVSKTFSDLYVPVPDPTTGAGITAQQYSHLFRVLYNSTYLSPVDSERALQLLTETTFTRGLVAGVPAGTTVAHKFGETTLAPAPGTASSTPAVHELHDCGIVYYPAHPYFICVMSRGTDYAALTNVIQGTSRTVWQQVDTLYKDNSDPESGFL